MTGDASNENRLQHAFQLDLELTPYELIVLSPKRKLLPRTPSQTRHSTPNKQAVRVMQRVNGNTSTVYKVS